MGPIYNQNYFYSSISEYYSQIFPYKPVQHEFVSRKLNGLKGKRILDIGCATGELASQLAKEGANVIGIDLNNELLSQARKYNSLPNISYEVGDMLYLTEQFNAGFFDAVICFGNTLVHLKNLEEISKMLHGAYSVLKPNGSLLIQILNYDYIIDNKIKELPIIENDYINFIRRYKHLESNSQILFQTNLHLKKEDRLIANETLLFGLGSEDLRCQLKTAGFKNINFFADFNENPAGGQHLPLVIKCKK